MRDTDTNRQYYVSEGDELSWQVDLAPTSSTHGTTIAPGNIALPVDVLPMDWVYLLGQGHYLWASAHDNSTDATAKTNILIRWSTTDHT